MDDDDDAQVQRLSDLLYEDGANLPEGVRHGLALVAGPGLVEEGDFPEHVVRVLLATNLLRQLGEGADYWSDARAAVEAAATTTVSDWPVEGYATPRPYWREGPSDDRVAFERVSDRMRAMEEAARWAEETVEDAGLQFDGVLKVPPGPAGGKHRRVFTDAVEALLEARDGPRKNDDDLREELASKLSPFFGDELLSTLKDTIDNVRRR